MHTVSRKCLFILWSLLFSALLSAQEVGIKFHTGLFCDALAKAKVENKYLFVDCFTTWCGPCKELEKEVFIDKSVADYFNEKFINFRLDVEKGEGIELRKRFGVQPVPTLLFINSDGKVEHKFIGSSSPEEFLRKTEEVFTNEKRYGVLERKYAKGDRDLLFMADYLNELLKQTEYSKARDLLATVIAENPVVDICDATFWPIITHDWIAESHSVYYNLLIDNHDTFIRNIGRETYNTRMSEIYKRYAGAWIFSGAKKGSESEDIARAGRDVIRLSLDDSLEVLLLLEIAGSRVQKDYDKFLSVIEDNYNIIPEEEKFKIFVNSGFFPKEATAGQSNKYLLLMGKFVRESDNATYKDRLARVIKELENATSTTK
jgi:thiol-disulfide isomerase/thioredoxin